MEDTDFNDDKIIKNIELEKYVKFRLGKEDFSLEDLDSIKEIFLTSKTFTGNTNFVFFEEINLFKKLEKIRFDNLGITPIVINIIKNSNVKNVEFENCEILTFERLNNIETLTISNCTIENISSISSLNSLKKLYFCLMTEEQLSQIPAIENLEFLSIVGIDNFSKEDIAKFKNLKYLSIGKQDLEKFADIIDNINIEIIIEDSYEEI